MTLEDRLNKLRGMKYRWNELHRIITEYLLAPMLAELISTTGRVHRTDYRQDGSGNINGVILYAEREKRPGFRNWLARMFSPWRKVLKVSHSGLLFVCEYYRHSYFAIAEKLQAEYKEKLYKDFSYDFVIVDKVK